jgi:hypothetical protein
MTGLDCQTVLVFKTNIQNEFQRSYVQIIMNSIYGVHDCTVDLDDVDKVLRVEIDCDKIDDNIDESFIIEKINSLGFMCKSLEDSVL